MNDQNIMPSSTNDEFYELEPGEVLDVILDDQHPDFKTYEDIGKAKVRLLYSQTDLSTEKLNDINM